MSSKLSQPRNKDKEEITERTVDKAALKGQLTLQQVQGTELKTSPQLTWKGIILGRFTDEALESVHQLRSFSKSQSWRAECSGPRALSFHNSHPLQRCPTMAGLGDTGAETLSWPTAHKTKD